MTLRSAFLLGMLEFILAKGLEYIENYTEEKKAEVEAFVKDLIPGEDFDVLGWSAVQMLMPTVFEVAKELVDKIDGVEGPARLAMLMQGVAKIVKAV